MEDIFKDLLGVCALVYIDDIVIYTSSCFDCFGFSSFLSL